MSHIGCLYLNRRKENDNVDNVLKTKYICSRDKCVWKINAGCGIWLCPFKYCIERSGKRPYYRIKK